MVQIPSHLALKKKIFRFFIVTTQGVYWIKLRTLRMLVHSVRLRINRSETSFLGTAILATIKNILVDSSFNYNFTA